MGFDINTRSCSGRQNKVWIFFSRILAESWSGTSFIGFGSPRRRTCQCFCVRSIFDGQFRAQIQIWESGKRKVKKYVQSCRDQMQRNLRISMKIIRCLGISRKVQEDSSSRPGNIQWYKLRDTVRTPTSGKYKKNKTCTLRFLIHGVLNTLFLSHISTCFFPPAWAWWAPWAPSAW